MTLWENNIKVGMGFEPRTNEFVMAHVVASQYVVWFKLLFIIVIVLQIYEILRVNTSTLSKSLSHRRLAFLKQANTT